MRKNTSGFTLVEVLVVCVVITILAAIAYFSYIAYQNQARDSAVDTTTRLVADFQTKYYNTNGEYMSSRDMVGAGVDGTALTDAQYDTLAQKLRIDKSSLTNDQWKFAPAISSVGISSPSQSNVIYLMTKDSNNGSVYSFNIGSSGCTVTFPADVTAPNLGTTAYAIAYYSLVNNRWLIYRSSTGNVTIGPASGAAQPCVFEDS